MAKEVIEILIQLDGPPQETLKKEIMKLDLLELINLE
jgi:hypothetical protein